MIDQLNQLAALHQQGVLTDDEFAAAKAKLFGPDAQLRHVIPAASHPHRMRQPPARRGIVGCISREEPIMPAQTVKAPARAVHRYQLDSGIGRLTPAERVARGKAARAEVPRDSHAVFDPPSDRADPIALLEEQARSRVPELVPVRWGRMLVSPFTYYRGAALPMASDLAATPVSGLPCRRAATRTCPTSVFSGRPNVA